MHIPPISSTDTSNLSSDSDILTKPGVITHLFDISAASKSTPLDPDLHRLVLAIKSDDFGSQAQTFIIDLIRLLAHIRKQNSETWQTQSALAYKTAFSVADSQKKQAKAQAISEQVNAAVSIVQGAAEGALAAGSAAFANRAISKYKQEAAAKDWTIEDPNAASRTQAAAGPREFTKPAGSPPAYSEKAGASNAAARSDDFELEDTKAVKPGDDEGSAESSAAPRIEDTRAKEQFLADKARNYYSKSEMRSRAVNALITVLSGGLKQVSSKYTIEVGEHQAAATIEQAAMQYLNSQGQYSNDYANELREYIRSILEMTKSVEQARHQAANAINTIA